MSEIAKKAKNLLEQSHVMPTGDFAKMAIRCVADLLAELERVEKERNDSMREASRLAISLYKTYYTQDSPNWGLCDTPAGVITQIDNMITGIADGEKEKFATICKICVSRAIKRIDESVGVKVALKNRINELVSENERLKEFESCTQSAAMKIRKQAAKECVDEMEGYPTTVSVHVTSHDAKIATQTKNELIYIVKDYFKIN